MLRQKYSYKKDIETWTAKSQKAKKNTTKVCNLTKTSKR